MPRPLLILLPFPEVDTLFEPLQGIAHTRRCIQLHAKLTAFSDCRSFEEKIFDTWWQKPLAPNGEVTSHIFLELYPFLKYSTVD